MGKKKKKKKEMQPQIERISLGKKNYIVLGAGVFAIILGYIALALGSITLAPILLVGGYAVLIPLGLMLK